MDAKKLLGLVFAVSESVQVSGLLTTFGMIDYSIEPESECCEIVSQILEYGGIPFVKGNISQAQIPFNDA